MAGRYLIFRKRKVWNWSARLLVDEHSLEDVIDLEQECSRGNGKYHSERMF